MVYAIDHYFKDHALLEKLGIGSEDIVCYEDCDVHEPTTQQVDRLRDRIIDQVGVPSAVVGMGGGSIMDIAKALSLMLKQEGSSSLYQGLDLIKHAGVHPAFPPFRVREQSAAPRQY